VTQADENQRQQRESGQSELLEKAILHRIGQLGLESDPAFMLELIASYEPLFQNQLKNIRDALTKKDSVKLHYAAHSLKGASLNIGAATVAGSCRDIEDLAERKNFEAIQACIGNLDKEVQKTVEALTSIKTKLSQQKPSP
jgi:two-component system, sensor histidine kinase and response regulator